MTSIVDKADWLVERPDGLSRLCRPGADEHSSLVLEDGRYSFFVETSTDKGVSMCTRLGVAEVLGSRSLAFTPPNGGGEDVILVNTWERLKIRRGVPSPGLQPGQLEFEKRDELGDNVVIWLLSAVDVQNELSVVSGHHPVTFAFTRSEEQQEPQWVVSQGGGKNPLLYEVSRPVVSPKPGCPNGAVLRGQEVSDDGGEGARARMAASRNGPPF